MSSPDEEALRQLVVCANEEQALVDARRELIRLFEADLWEIVKRAEVDGKRILREKHLGKQPTRWGICEYVLARLRSGFPLRAIGMGEPPGIHGIAHIMKNADGNGLYIKVKIEDGEVKVLSFHY